MPDGKNISVAAQGSPSSAASSDIAIVGMAGRFPGARNVDEFWSNLCRGVESITQFTAQELLQLGAAPDLVNDPHFVKANASLSDYEFFDAAFFGYHPREAQIMDPQQRIILECAWEALENSGQRPADCDGVIGVYAGAAANTYLLFHLASNPALETVDRVQINLSNSEDFVATRISYKLNLSGPSLSVRTACSTSLVAVHLACQSLLAEECDMALAGGVAVNLSQKFGYRYMDGGIASPDGHCRPFDADAQGTIFASGVGMVVLKRLADAQTAGNSIIAVIKGSAINNDGAAKVGYTAPSVSGQAEVIAEAHSFAGIDPESIRYVEAHGTATAIGDPIEVEALTKAFRARTQAAGFCAIGSVKGNVGHLDAAAGIAGLIKTALVLQHRRIPPSLHFRRPNPQIDFARTPFFVNRMLADWPAHSSPARAAVSSFGIGGTNAHVILEEPPRVTASSPGNSPHLLVLSSKTPAALESATDKLAEHLALHPELSLADAAYTLQVGRQSFPYRRAVLCRDVGKVVHALRGRDTGSVFTAHVSPATERSVGFLVPAPGLEFIKLACDLYDHFASFRTEMDSGCEILRQYLHHDLRVAVFAEAKKPDVALSRSPLALPAVLIAQLALARSLMSCGVRPSVLLGEGLGQLVAACLAGVFSPGELLELAAQLGSLNAASPGTCVLEIDSPGRDIAERISGSLVLAGHSGASPCIVSGSADEIRDFEKQLTQSAIQYRPVDTISGFVPSDAENGGAQIRSAFQRMRLRAPEIPLIASDNGTRIDAADAMAPGYWASVITGSVSHDAGFQALEKDSSLILLELGPRARLRVAGHNPSNGKGGAKILSPLQETEDGELFLWATLGNLWLQGIQPEWSRLHPKTRLRLPLPTYPFERQRYWIEAHAAAAHGSHPAITDRSQLPPASSSPVPEPKTEKEMVMAEARRTLTLSTSRQVRILDSLKDVVVRISGLNISALDESANFSELGFDSLLLLQMNQAIGDKFHVSLTLRQLFEECPSLTKLASFIDSQLQPENEQGTARKVLPVPSSEVHPETPSLSRQAVIPSFPDDPEQDKHDQEGVDSSGVGKLMLQQTRLMMQQLEILQKWMQAQRETQSPGDLFEGRVDRQPPPEPTHREVPAKRSNGESQAFVAYQPLDLENGHGFEVRQQEHLQKLMADYTRRTRGSRDTIQLYRPVLANNRNVAGFRIPLKEMVYQIIAKEADGSKFRDIDGNEYVDISMGFGVYLFGHNAPFIREAVEEELRLGAPLGPFSRNAGAVAQLIQELTGVERVAFFNSGTEAVMVALRLARAATGRAKIALFAGSFHGTFDGILARADFSSGQGRSLPLAPGVPAHITENVLVLNYGSPDALETIRAHAHELAAILVEPVQSRRPDFQPREFLEELRALTAWHGIALIFDEVITGFRIAPGGAQAHFEIQADLVTYGKVIGGGLPIGVVAGKARYMDSIDGGMWQFGDMSYPERENQRTFVAGTFCQHPMAMAAAKAVLHHLREQGPALQQRLNERTARLTEMLDSSFKKSGAPIHMARFGSLFRFVPRADLELLFYHLMKKGIYIWEGRNCFLSTAHTDQDIEEIFRAVEESVDELRHGGFVPKILNCAGQNGDSVPVWGTPSRSVVANGDSPATEEPRHFPLTQGQKELWLLSQLNPAASSAYNEAIILRLRGPIDIDRMRGALQALFARHEALRIVISPDGETQHVLSEHALEIPHINLAESGREPVNAEDIRHLIIREGSRTFDLARGPLLRACLIQTNAVEHLLLFVVHHIVADDWSRAVLLEELGILYAAPGLENIAALGPAVPFHAFAEWQKRRLEQDSPQSFKASEYWRGLFASPLTSLELPTDRSRRRQEYLGERCSLTLPASLHDELKRLAGRENTTVFVLLLSCFTALLHHLSGQKDILLGVPTTGQPRMGVKSMVGQCIAMLPFNTSVDGDEPFPVHLREVRNRLFDLLEYQDYFYLAQLEKHRQPAQLPALTVMFNMDRMISVPSFADMKADLQPYPVSHVKFDLSLNCIAIDQELHLQFDYRKDLFEAATIDFWARSFEGFLRKIACEPQEGSLRKLIVASPSTRPVAESAPVTTARESQTLLGRFMDQVERLPETPAILIDAACLTYAELAQQADQFANLLKAAERVPGRTVALYLQHPVDVIRCFLGAAKAGFSCRMVPPGLPGELHYETLRGAGACLLVTREQKESLPVLAGLQGLKWETEDGVETSRNGDITVPAEEECIVVLDTTGNQSPYVLSQRAILSHCEMVAQTLHFAPDDRLLTYDRANASAMLNWILPGLLTGATLVFAEPKQLSAEGSREYVEDSHRTVVELTVAMLRRLTQLAAGQVPLFPSGLRCLVRGSSPVASGHLARWGKLALGNSRLWFGYQPEHSPRIVAINPIQSAAGESRRCQFAPSSSLSVRDDRLEEVLGGVIGRLYVQADASPGRHGGGRTSPWLATNERARLRTDGTVEAVGHISGHVTARGRSAELMEITAAVMECSEVRDAIVVSRETADIGESTLDAYIVPVRHPDGGGPDTPTAKRFFIEKIRVYLREQLPDYIHPSRYVVLEQLPLLQDGTVEVEKLPAAENAHRGRGAYEKARTAMEEQVAAIWRRVLQIEEIGIHENFFEVGGHSLLALTLAAETRSAFSLRLTMRNLFEAPTIAQMAALIEAQEDADLSELPPSVKLPQIQPQGSLDTPFPLTDVQQAYWVGRSGILGLGNVSTHTYYEVESDTLDLLRFERAWQAMIDRHSMLRAIVLPHGEQKILSQTPPYKFKIYDFSALDEEQAMAGLEEIRERMSHQVLPSDQWPLFEICVSRLDGARLRLHISMDALIVDAWSMQVLFHELSSVYNNFGANLPPLTLTFRDYVLGEKRIEQSESYRLSLDYWNRRLATLPPAPELPLARAPESLDKPRFVRWVGRLDPATWQRLKTRAATSNITPSVALLAAYAEVLALWSKSPQFTLNVTLFNRLPLHPEVNEIVGDFTSVTLLAIDNTQADCFENRARRIQKQFWEDLEHRYVSGVRILRDLARMRRVDNGMLMPVVFTSSLIHREGDVEVSPMSWLGNLEFSITQTPQVWLDHEVYEDAGSLVFTWDVVAELFPPGLVDGMFAAFGFLLEKLSNNRESWSAAWPGIAGQLLPQACLETVAGANATEKILPGGLLHLLFAAQALQYPERLGILTASRSFTYGDIARRASITGQWLRSRGARVNTLVAIVMAKGWEQIVGALGVLYSGAAYLPIDPGLPRERILYLLEHGQVSLVLTQSWFFNQFQWPEHICCLCVDGMDGELQEHIDDLPLENLQSPEDLAYVIFTSGSTGLPKGVMIDHRGAVNTIQDLNERYGIGSRDRVLALSSLSFDLSVYDIFGLLAAGGAVVIPDPWATRDPVHWAELIIDKGVTVWNSVPTLMEMLVEHAESRDEVLSSSLRLIFMSGDWIPVTLPDRVRKLLPNAHLVSMGGATEASIWSILYEIGDVAREWKSIPYGKPMLNQTFYVLDQHLEPRPTWVPGQLYIGGIGLAKGYWRDADKTAASFITHPRTCERLYRTGDLGRYLPDGNIEFLGREDYQVKVQGHRIELGEIESVLSHHPKVRAAAVAAVGEQRGNKRLIAYIVPHSADSDSSRDIELKSAKARDWTTDPLALLKFKLEEPGIRSEPERSEIFLSKSDLEDAEDRYIQRRSYRSFAGEPLTFQRLGHFLACLQQYRIAGSPLPKYLYGSAGSLYPVQLYLYVKPAQIAGLNGGVYYYHPRNHSLVVISNGLIHSAVYDPNDRSQFEEASFALFLIANLKVGKTVYPEQGEKYATIEAGLMTQLLEATAASEGIGLCQIGRIDFGAIRHSFALNDDHALIHSALGGPISEYQRTLPAFREETRKYQALVEMIDQSAALEPPELVVSNNDVAQEVKNWLEQQLPEYMVPFKVIVLDSLPLSSNGKVDRNALPHPEEVPETQENVHIPPRTDLERDITRILQEVLGTDRIGVHDNFFDLGGNSVHLIQFHNRLQQLLGDQKIPVTAMFRHVTVSSLAEYLGQSVPQEIEDRAEELTAGKERLGLLFKRRSV